MELGHLIPLINIKRDLNENSILFGYYILENKLRLAYIFRIRLNVMRSNVSNATCHGDHFDQYFIHKRMYSSSNNIMNDLKGHFNAVNE